MTEAPMAPDTIYVQHNRVDGDDGIATISKDDLLSSIEDVDSADANLTFEVLNVFDSSAYDAGDLPGGNAVGDNVVYDPGTGEFTFTVDVPENFDYWTYNTFRYQVMDEDGNATEGDVKIAWQDAPDTAGEDDAPVITNSTTDEGGEISINWGGTYQLSQAVEDGSFEITDSDTSDANLMLTVEDVQGGQLWLVSMVTGILPIQVIMVTMLTTWSRHSPMLKCIMPGMSILSTIPAVRVAKQVFR